MKNVQAPPHFEHSLQNLAKAFDSLQRFLKEPLRSQVVLAGIVQAYEYTFEIFWKTFQKVVEANGVNAGSPRLALVAAFQMSLIENQDVWINMMKDRNLTCHVYNLEVAENLVEKIQNSYLEHFHKAEEVLRNILRNNQISS